MPSSKRTWLRSSLTFPPAATSSSPTAHPSGIFSSIGLAFMTAPIICTAIYAMTDFGGYFWPMWVWLGCSIPALTTVLSRR